MLETEVKTGKSVTFTIVTVQGTGYQHSITLLHVLDTVHTIINTPLKYWPNEAVSLKERRKKLSFLGVVATFWENP